MSYADEETRPMYLDDRPGNHLSPIAGEIVVESVPEGRGQSVTRPDGQGIYVGIFRWGVECICFEPGGFLAACEAFDRLAEETKT